MLTMYEDQLRFDRAFDSGADSQERADDLMSCVRLDRQLINGVDVSDNSPRPLCTSQSVTIHKLLSSSIPLVITAAQGRFYVGAGGHRPPKFWPDPPPKYFGSNSKNTHC